MRLCAQHFVALTWWQHWHGECDALQGRHGMYIPVLSSDPGTQGPSAPGWSWAGGGAPLVQVHQHGANWAAAIRKPNGDVCVEGRSAPGWLWGSTSAGTRLRASWAA